MALLKKVLLGVASVVSLGLVGNSFAVTTDISTVVTSPQVLTAATALVAEIKADPNGNHVFPGKSAYVNLALQSVNSFTGTFAIDDSTHFMHHINITSVDFNATGVPLINTYNAVISLEADVSPDCKTLTNATYKLVKGNGSLIDGLFQTDLSSYAHVVFDSLLANSGLTGYCQK